MESRDLYIGLFFVVLCVSYTSAQTQLCTSEVIFVLDESTSMTDEDFAEMLLFAGLVILDMPDFGRADGTKVGLIKFSTRAKVQYTPNTYDNKTQAALDTLKIEFDGGITNTHLAFEALWGMLNQTRRERPIAKKIAIMLTDGNADDVPLTQRVAAQVLADHGHEMVIMAIGSFVNATRMRPLASRPENYIEVAGFGSLNDTKARINQIICDLVCGDPPPANQMPLTHRFEQPFPLKTVGVDIDVLVPQPLQPIIFSTLGLCAFNDSTINGDTLTFLGEVERAVGRSTALDSFKRDCYNLAMRNLRLELQRTIPDCEKIARLTLCGVKILRRLTDVQIDPLLIDEGQLLADTWKSYQNSDSGTTDPTEAVRVVGLQRQAIQELAIKRNQAPTTEERNRLQALITDIQQAVALNGLKIEYSDLITDMNDALTRDRRNFAAIGLIQNRMATSLRAMRTSSTDQSELSAIAAALSRLEPVISVNTDYVSAVARLRTEETRGILIGDRLVNAQKDVLQVLRDALNLPVGTLGLASVQPIFDRLDIIITLNELIDVYNGQAQEINRVILQAPNNFAAIAFEKRVAVDILQQLVGNSTTAADRSAFQNVIDGIEREFRRNEVYLEYNRIANLYTIEAGLNTPDNSELLRFLRLMIAELRSAIPQAETAAERNDLNDQIQIFDEAATCLENILAGK